IVRAHADVAVGDDEQVVLGLGREPRESADFVVDGVAAGAEKQANLALGEILAAEAGVVLVGVLVESLDRLQAAYGRKKVGVRSTFSPRNGEKPRGAIEREQVIDERDCSDAENDVAKRQNLSTSCTSTQVISTRQSEGRSFFQRTTRQDEADLNIPG